MTRQDLQNLNRFNQYVLGKNLDGLAHPDSLVQATPGTSTIYWLLGHILITRSGMMRLLGEAPLWSEEQGAPFARGSHPTAPAQVSLPFDRLLADLRRSDDLIRAAIDRARDEALAAPLGQGQDGTVGDQLAGFLYHEGYHAGQIGLLRRVAGRPAAIS